MPPSHSLIYQALPFCSAFSPCFPTAYVIITFSLKKIDLTALQWELTDHDTLSKFGYIELLKAESCCAFCWSSFFNQIVRLLASDVLDEGHALRPKAQQYRFYKACKTCVFSQCLAVCLPSTIFLCFFGFPKERYFYHCLGNMYLQCQIWWCVSCTVRLHLYMYHSVRPDCWCNGKKSGDGGEHRHRLWAIT